MAQSKASTVEEYLGELSEERREVVSAVRDLVAKNLPKGYLESMGWGMITYEIPLATYPNTYNGKPLGYMALAAQKNHYALYLMCVYQDPEREAWLKDEFKQAGKKLDMGKSCLRFRRVEDLPMKAIGELVRSVTPDQFIKQYESARIPK